MNCERFQTVASDLVRNEIMEAGERASALDHIDKCEGCALAWSAQRELSDGLRKVAEQMKTLPAPVQLEERLRAAFRDRSLASAGRPAPQRWRYWATAVAAALLIGVAVITWRAHVASLAQPTSVANSKGVSAATLESPPKAGHSEIVATGGTQRPDRSAPPKPAVPGPQHPKPQRPGRGDGALAKQGKRPSGESASMSVANETREVTTDFVALGYGNALDLQDGGQLVRVELPRSALARFGLPMNMNREDERVKADVLVGTDGLARAIRFVK